MNTIPATSPRGAAIPSWLKRTAIRLAALLPVAFAIYQVRHYVLTVHPSASDTQRITLLNQPAPQEPKPPEPEVKQPEPEPETLPTETKQQFFKFEDYAPGNPGGADKGPPGPSSDTLGLDTEGGPGSDAFGLAAKRGGRDITTLGSDTGNGSGGGGPSGQGEGGPMAKFAGYAYNLRDTVTAALNAHAELRVANYDAIVQIWIDPNGGVKRVALAKSTDIPKIDDDIRRAIERLPKLSIATPPDMPQPVDMRIVSKGASGYETAKPQPVNAR